MRTLGLLTTVWMVAACRGNFDTAPAPQSDAPPDDPPVMAQPDVIACGSPARFTVGSNVKHVYSSPTERGFVVITIDDNDAAFGSAYEFVSGRLTELAHDVPIATGTFGQVGVVHVDRDPGDGIELLVAAPYGDATSPTGTALLAFDARLRQVGSTVKHDGWLAGTGSLARSDDGTLVFLGITGSSEIDIKAVSRAGSDTGSAHPVDSSGNMTSQPTMFRAKAGYMVVWAAPAGSLAEAKVALVDESLNVTTPAAKVSRDTGENALNPVAAYSAAASAYAIAWAYKDGPGDVVAVSLRNDALAETPAQITATPRGNFPQIAAGKDDFLVVWQDGSTSVHLGGMRVTPGGATTFRGVPGTGGTAAGWDVTVRNDQPVLVWVENGGVGANLWLDPLCDAH